MHVKTGDKVKVMVGRDLGKTGKVLQVFPLYNKVVVEGANIRVKHMRAQGGKGNTKGQKIEYPSPLDISNVMVVCPACGAATRVGHAVTTGAVDENASKSRICKKCKEVI